MMILAAQAREGVVGHPVRVFGEAALAPLFGALVCHTRTPCSPA